MAQMLAAALQQPRESGISIERARKLGAKPYDGSGDPERALSWIEANEEIFQMMGCTEEQRVSYSAFLLKDCAKDWWKAHQRAHPEGVIWAEFKREFTERFGGADQCAIDVADHIPVSAFRAGLGVSDAARRAIS